MRGAESSKWFIFELEYYYLWSNCNGWVRSTHNNSLVRTSPINRTCNYFLVLVAYLIILGAIQAKSRESPRTIQVYYMLLGHYLYDKWDFLVQTRSANFLPTFQPFSGLISGWYPKKETQVSSSNIKANSTRIKQLGCQKKKKIY